MTEAMPQSQRSWEDLERMVNAAARVAVRQEMVDYTITITEIRRQTERLSRAVFGEPEARLPGVVARIDALEEQLHTIDAKLDQLIDAGLARSNQLAGFRMALYILAGVVTAFGGPSAISSLLHLFGVSI